MGMGAQSQRGASSMRPKPQMPQRPQMPQMPRAQAPQGLMALMQQRGKGAGMQGGTPQGGQMDPRMMEMMQRMQGGMPQGGMPTPGSQALQSGMQAEQMRMQQAQMPPGMGPQQFLAQQQGPSGGPGQIDPQMLAAMQAFQQQGGQGGVPMTMPPTGMPQMSGGIAGMLPRMMRGLTGF